MAMRRTSILSAALLLTTAACNGSVDANATDGTGGSNGTGAPTTSASSSGGTGGDSSGNTVTLTMDSFNVPAGAEVYKCQNFVNPFSGVDTEVQEFESHMALGSHHVLLFYKQGVTADGPLETCSGLEFAATPYGSQIPNDSLSFPPGVAALVPGSTGMRIQSHYLNTTGSDITAHVEITFHIAAPGTVQNQAGVLFVVDTDINVPPQGKQVDSNDCTIPFDMNILRASSHMHQHGTDFVATVSGSTVFQTTAWDDPKPALFDPAMKLQQGDPLHYACSFTNNSTSPLTFGESALTDEMCIFTASFYPTPAGQATVGANGCVSAKSQ
jgi:hypothetical protein